METEEFQSQGDFHGWKPPGNSPVAVLQFVIMEKHLVLFEGVVLRNLQNHAYYLILTTNKVLDKFMRPSVIKKRKQIFTILSKTKNYVICEANYYFFCFLFNTFQNSWITTIIII